MRRIGIDVGGTNTDAVLIEDGKVAGAVKAPTSEDVTGGIPEALAKLGATGALRGRHVDAVMIGTTHFINAVVQRRHLSKVAALRLGLPSGASLPPFCDWPTDLADLVRGAVLGDPSHDFVSGFAIITGDHVVSCSFAAVNSTVETIVKIVKIVPGDPVVETLGLVIVDIARILGLENVIEYPSRVRV